MKICQFCKKSTSEKVITRVGGWIGYIHTSCYNNLIEQLEIYEKWKKKQLEDTEK